MRAPPPSRKCAKADRLRKFSAGCKRISFIRNSNGAVHGQMNHRKYPFILFENFRFLVSILQKSVYPRGRSETYFPSRESRKTRKMQEKYRYGLWGAAAGAVALAVVGFTWGGWVTGSTARLQADAAGWTALLPVCADAILANPAAVAELKIKRTTDYDDVVRDHLKMIAGRGDMSFAFRRDCGKTIEARLVQAAVKK
jgi:hypothetical protein